MSTLIASRCGYSGDPATLQYRTDDVPVGDAEGILYVKEFPASSGEFELFYRDPDTGGDLVQITSQGAVNAAGGASAFTDLSDVPSSYTYSDLSIVRVNAGATALEFSQSLSLTGHHALGSGATVDQLHFGATAKQILNVRETASTFSARHFGVLSELTLAPTANTAVTARSGEFDLVTSTAFNFTGSLRAATVLMQHAGSGTASTCIGFQSLIQNAGGGTMTLGSVSSVIFQNTSGTVAQARGINLSGWSSAGATTLSYGIFADTSIDIGTTRWFIYSTSTSNSRMGSTDSFLGLGTDPTVAVDILSSQGGGNPTLRLTSANADDGVRFSLRPTTTAAAVLRDWVIQGAGTQGGSHDDTFHVIDNTFGSRPFIIDGGGTSGIKFSAGEIRIKTASGITFDPSGSAETCRFVSDGGTGGGYLIFGATVSPFGGSLSRNPLIIIRDQDDGTQMVMRNNSAGANATVGIPLNNGTNGLDLYLAGTANTTGFLGITANGGALFTSGGILTLGTRFAHSIRFITDATECGSVTSAGILVWDYEVELNAALNHDGTTVGFYGTTPIVQGASVADPTGGAVIDAEARTAISSLISRIEALGLIVTV